MKYLFLIPFSLFALDPSFKAGKDPDLVKAQELTNSEKILDQQILALNEKISKYLYLTKLDIIKTPDRVIYYNNPGYIEISTFNEIRQGLQIKALRIFHQDGKYTKSVFVIKDRSLSLSQEDAVIDTQPLNLNKDQVELLGDFFQRSSKLQVVDIENTVVHPNRITLKRDFYIPSLTYYLNILQMIREYNLRDEIKKETSMINFMKKSRRF